MAVAGGVPPSRAVPATVPSVLRGASAPLQQIIRSLYCAKLQRVPVVSPVTRFRVVPSVSIRTKRPSSVPTMTRFVPPSQVRMPQSLRMMSLGAVQPESLPISLTPPVLG